MTNFQAQKVKQKKILTREKLILAFPIAISIFVSLGLFFYLVFPKIRNSRSFLKEINGMKLKKEELIIQEQLLKQSAERLELESGKQEKLLNLVAGTEELYTYLSRLNQLAISNKISILEITPLQVEKFTPQSDNKTTNENSNVEKNADPLVVEGLEKRTINLKLEGSYPNLINFLKLIERLPMIVITSDFKVDKFPNTSYTKKGIKNQYFLNNMDLKLSIYGRDL